MKKRKKMTCILCGIGLVLVLLPILGLIITGASIGWGPFQGLYWKKEVRRIRQTYKEEENQNSIVFYGASNFRLWTEMTEDLSEYKIVNAGFGGSTDKLLVKYADKLLYSYHPKVVFLQTGSNDYVAASGTEVEKVSSCMEYKKEMIDLFHDALPETKFVIMSGLLLPGRLEYTSLTMKINQDLQEYAQTLEYVDFVDATELTYDGDGYKGELFLSDGIHLNHDGQLLWCENYIAPEIELLIEEYPELECVRK